MEKIKSGISMGAVGAFRAGLFLMAAISLWVYQTLPSKKDLTDAIDKMEQINQQVINGLDHRITRLELRDDERARRDLQTVESLAEIKALINTKLK